MTQIGFRTSSPRLLAVLAAALASFFSVASASADSPVKLGITPVGVDSSYFNLTMTPGEHRDLAVQLGNAGAEPIRARTYAADAYTLVNGGYGTRLDGEPTSGTTTWIAYPSDTLSIDPGTDVTRTFTVSVPPDAQPGQYLASLVIQNAEPVKVDGAQGGKVSMGFNQTIRQAIAVSITVPGPTTPGLQIGAASHKMVAGKSVVAVALTNTGSVRLKPSGQIVLKDAAGTEVGRAPIQMNTFYAGTATSIEVPQGKLLQPGDYVASLTLSDPSGVKASADRLPFSVAAPPAKAAAAAGEAASGAAVNQDAQDGAAGAAASAPSAAPAAGQAGQTSSLVLLAAAAGGGAAVVVLGLGGVYLWSRKRRARLSL